jgi:hypothetical protein
MAAGVPRDGRTETVSADVMSAEQIAMHVEACLTGLYSSVG